MVEIRVRESEKQSEAGGDAERATHVTSGKMKVFKHTPSWQDVAKVRPSNERVNKAECNI
jgi:hypothetical protein